MAYPELHQTNWEAVWAARSRMVTGIVTVRGGTILLYWNEVRPSGGWGDQRAAASRSRWTTSQGRSHPGGKGDLCDGRADTGRAPRTYLRRPPAIDISRRVEYHQWQEHSRQETRKLGGGGRDRHHLHTTHGMGRWADRLRGRSRTRSIRTQQGPGQLRGRDALRAQCHLQGAIRCRTS